MTTGPPPPTDPGPPPGGASFPTLSQWQWLLQAVAFLVQQEIQSVATEAELQSSIDQIANTLNAEDGVITTLTTAFATLQQKITDLSQQVATGTPVSQEQLDALQSEANTAASQAANQLTQLQALVPAA